MKIKTQGSQAFNVPNNPLGRFFLHLLKRYRNRGWYYRARGRGSRKEHGCQASIPKEHSEWMAVYMSPKTAYGYMPNVAPPIRNQTFTTVRPSSMAVAEDHSQYAFLEGRRGEYQRVYRGVPVPAARILCRVASRRQPSR